MKTLYSDASRSLRKIDLQSVVLILAIVLIVLVNIINLISLV
ncbi:MAG: hypothetical protein NZM38_07860 [Cytophagales bacterium]|nr:hypothetical protein [Cytophagales bacterium]MDW8384672.1 hypothetical protein [Flammeovirgaceae bacterium]